MGARGKESRSGMTSAGVVLVVGVILAILAGRSVQGVLSVRMTGDPPAGGAAGSAAAPVGDPDNSVASATVSGRDPFRPPPAPRPEGQASVRQPVQKVTEPPVVRALLYDNVNPTVQIGIGGETSGWLHIGDLFEGWTVVDITATSVRVSRDGESVVLPSS